MSDTRYKIVFDGALQPGVDIATAKLNLADLFKSDVAAIERLFSGRPVALKRELSHTDAQTYLQALQKTGIDPRIEAETAIELNLSDVHDPAPATAYAASAEPASPYAPPRSQVGEQLAEYSTLKPFGIEGRIGRLRYLAWTMVLTLVSLPVIGVFALIVLGMISGDSTTGLIVGGLIAIVVGLAFGVASIFIFVQRLHDIGWSGWLWLLNLVPFVGSFFPLVIMCIPGNATANRYGPPPPPNSTAVKVLSSLWVVFIALVFIGALFGGIQAIQQEYDSNVDTGYESGAMSTDDVEVDVVPPVDSQGDAAEEPQPPVDSAQE